MKKTLSVTGCIAFFALALPQLPADSPVDSPSARDERWANRNVAAEEAAVAERFKQALNLGGGFGSSGLIGRVELRPLAALYNSSNGSLELVAKFKDYFYGKLRNPKAYGLAIEDFSPFGSGFSGYGHWPKPAWDASKSPDAVIAEADALLKGQIQLGGKTVEIGLPGQVNWYYPLPYGNLTDPEGGSKNIPDASVVFGTFLSPLAQAYTITRDPKYLTAWQDYLDDWSLNSTFIDHVHPLKVPSSISSGSTGFEVMIRSVAAVANADVRQDPLPTRIFAQVMEKLFMAQPFLNLAYIRSNCHNWTPFPNHMKLSMVGDEFVTAPIFFRESKRRYVEDNAVTQNLRDGTENQQCPWYNDNYHHTLGAVKLLEHRGPSWREVDWVRQAEEDPRWLKEISEHLNERVNYQIRLRTPQNTWPIPYRGGDKRPGNVPSREVSPEAYDDPINRAILSATSGGADRPPYHSDWFPYGGYSIVRDGWEPKDGYGAMFASPKPGAYGGYRSRSNNNVFGLAAEGQDLLVDDCIGHYMYPGSPLLVDGQQQFFHAQDGTYKVGGLSNHKTYQARAWTDPAPWRWHASEAFNVMEGIYSGPYGDLRAKKTVQGSYGPEESQSPTLGFDEGIRGVSHQRVAQYVREAKLWILTDRVSSESERKYTQVWMLPQGDHPEPAFKAEDFVIDKASQTISTESTATVKSSAGQVPKANVTLYQFSPTKLTYTSIDVPKDPNNRYMLYGRKEILATWRAAGPSQVVTLIQPRPQGQAKLSATTPLSPVEGINGFEASLADGKKLSYLSSANGSALLRLDNVEAKAESLLLYGDRGVALGCESLSLGGKSQKTGAIDFEFAIKDGVLADVKPIRRPIAPVEIGPDRTAFSGSMDVTMSTQTPGVEIRYTLDGSEPGPQSPLYTAPVKIDATTHIKARAFRPGLATRALDTTGTLETPVSTASFHLRNPVEPIAPRRVKDGLRFRYWQDDWKSLWALGDLLKPSVDSSVPALFDLSKVPAENPPLGEKAAPRRDYFAVQYDGFLEIPEDGVYTFRAPEEFAYPDIDPGYELRVFVGNKMGRPPLDNRVVGLQEWYPSTRLHAFGNWSVPLKKGLHPFKVFLLDYRTDAVAYWNKPNLKPYIWAGETPDLRISGPGIDNQPIPVTWMKH
jgi:hypothetical protein